MISHSILMRLNKKTLGPMLAGVAVALGTFVACGGDEPLPPSGTPGDVDGSRVAPVPGSDSAPPEGSTVDATSDASASAPLEVSGTRLRARRLHADGLTQFLGWHDTLEDVECSKSVLGTQPACAPPFFLTPQYAFPTAACDPASRLVVVRSVGCGTGIPAVGLSEPSPDADAGDVTTLYRLGTPVALDECWNGGNCQSSPFCTQLAPLAAALSTVPALLTNENGVRMRTYADGARELDAFLAGETPCTALSAADGTLRCFAEQPAATAVYLDNACTDAVYPTSQVRDGRIAIDEAGECGAVKRRLFLTGAPLLDGGVGSVPIYRRQAGGCTPLGNQISVMYIRAGAELPTEALPAVGAAEHGTGRLRARYQTVAGRERFASWFDTELGVSCSFETRGTEQRCVPNERLARLPTSGSLNLYADAQCLVLQRLDPKPSTEECAEAPLYFTDNLPATCGRTGALWRIKASAASYEMRDGVCAPSTIDTSGYVSVEAIEDAQLVSGAEITE